MTTSYTEYKNSGCQWLGIIPSSWETGVIGSLYSQRSTKVSDNDYPPLSVTMRGVLPQLATVAKTDAHDARKLVLKGDFAINSRSDRRGSCGISDNDGSVSLINTVLVPRGKMNPQYYNWLFHTVQFADEYYRNGHGIVDDLWTTRWDEMKRIVIPVPPELEQAVIAGFLKKKVGAIDAVISEARASIEEYKAWRASIIFEAVTKGLDPNVEMKDSGVKWLGTVPQHWTVSRLKTVVAYIESGVSVNASQSAASEGKIGVLKTSSVSKYVFNPTENKEVNSDELNRVACQVRANTIIVSRMNTPELVGACGYVEKDYPLLFLPDRLWQVHFVDSVSAKYVYYYLCSNYIKNYYASLSSGTSSSMQNISQGQFLNAAVLLPERVEQEDVVEFLDKKCADIDTMILEKESLISDLESYKRSLIFEVVTGKRRVF
ncbi:MAG: type I restriction endonuclease subunit S [Ruminococcaceae bacterium]|nr:type I restriction endonuclease subunit S [Oscillospiraceae bacterium]